MKIVSRRRFLLAGIPFIGLLSYPFWFEQFFFKTEHHKISLPKLAGIQFALISDLHLRSINKFHKSVAKRINLESPDFILINGDSVDDNGNLSVLDDFLSLIDQSIPKLAILGNWEYWGNVNLNELATVYQRHRCTLLINQSYQINTTKGSIGITGYDDLLGGKPSYSISKITSDYHIAMAHCPQQRDIIQKSGVPADLTLSGHTHGGQLNLFGLAPFRPPGSGKYLAGWYGEDFYVSRGIGTSIFPARLGSRAELTLFEFV